MTSTMTFGQALRGDGGHTLAGGSGERNHGVYGALTDKHHQGKGLGQALLKDALLPTDQAADIAGIRCVLVHAKDDDARRGYESWNCEPSPTDAYHLFFLLKDLRAMLV